MVPVQWQGSAFIYNINLYIKLTQLFKTYMLIILAVCKWDKTIGHVLYLAVYIYMHDIQVDTNTTTTSLTLHGVAVS